MRSEFVVNRSLGLFIFLKSCRYGFYSISSLLYNFEKDDKKNYLSDWKRLAKTSQINGKRKVVLDDKLVFHHLNKNNPKVLPVVAITQVDKLYDRTSYPYKIINSYDKLKSFVLKFENGVVFKPYRGGGGSQIGKVVYMNEELSFSGHCNSYEQFKERVLKNSKHNFIVTEVIKQNNVISEIYPDTLNTVRILTMIDYETNKPFIAAAVQRIGMKRSNVVDNWTAGGISIKVDVSTGKMGKGALYPGKKDKTLIWHTAHPDTGVKFEGTKIPNWENICDFILKLSEEFYYLPYIGWDVVSLKDDFKILEGNTNSDINLLQIHGGLLKDDRVREFYKKHNVIQ